MCVSPQALVSALILRIEQEGVVPTSDELATVMGAGCRREDIRRRLATLAAARPELPFAQAIAVRGATPVSQVRGSSARISAVIAVRAFGNRASVRCRTT